MQKRSVHLNNEVAFPKVVRLKEKVLTALPNDPHRNVRYRLDLSDRFLKEVHEAEALVPKDRLQDAVADKNFLVG